MPGVRVVLLNSDGVRFTDNMTLRRQYLCESIPIIGVECAIPTMLYFVVESAESCSITTAEHPGHSSPAATVNGLDDPKLVFFLLTKCHISSNSICLISPDTAGSGSLHPASTIQRYTKDGEVLNIFARIRNDALPRE